MTIEEIIFKWEAWVTSMEIYIEDVATANNFSLTEPLQREADIVKQVLLDLKQAKPHYEETIH